MHPRAYHLSDICTLNEKYDYVLLLAKAYDTRWMSEFIKPYLQDDGLLVGVQNAMTVDDIADIVGASRTLGCVIEMSSEIFTPGIVQRNNTPEHTWFGIGSVDPSTADRVAEVEEILLNVGKVTVSSDIMSAKWMKLVVNTMCLGPHAMLGLTPVRSPRGARYARLYLTCWHRGADGRSRAGLYGATDIWFDARRRQRHQ